MSDLKVVKTLSGFSCAHRLWTADSHCSFIHGYDRKFDLEISAHTLDDNGWVYDFAGFKQVKKALEDQFDHTLCISRDDPHVDTLRALDQDGAVDLRLMDHPGIEGAVDWARNYIGPMVMGHTDGRAWLSGVTCWENAKNRVTWSETA